VAAGFGAAPAGNAPKLLTEAIQACLTDPRMREGARRVAQMMKYEDGVREVVNAAIEASTTYSAPRPTSTRGTTSAAT
jgi:UDP:flavonoid glycosyltransferase YjiC (YdhE family)